MKSTRYKLIHKKTKVRVLCSSVALEHTSWKVAWRWELITCGKCLALRKTIAPAV